MTVAMRTERDRGPKRALITSIVIGSLGSTLYVIADAARFTPRLRWFAPKLAVIARLTTGIWTGGKMVVEQSYIGEASAPERTTQITSEVGVFAVLGFVMGPTVGAVFSPIDVGLYPGSRAWRIDEYTAPGYFMLVLCLLMIAATWRFFDPAKGYANPADNAAILLRTSNEGPALEEDGYGSTAAKRLVKPSDEPDKAGLATLLFCFLAHFYSFAIQETITTPFVEKRFGWSQRQIDYLFAGVGLLSLLTSLLVSQLAKCCSDVSLLLLSLIFGLLGSIALFDPPLGPTLTATRFLVGFAFITIAFPFGRNVSLAMFSKVLGPTPQGSWMGLMFVVGALPRCLGPSWSLYALRLSCRTFPLPVPCPPGGRTCLEFAINGLLFAICLGLVVLHKRNLLPFDLRHGSYELAPSSAS